MAEGDPEQKEHLLVTMDVLSLRLVICHSISVLSPTAESCDEMQRAGAMYHYIPDMPQQKCSGIASHIERSQRRS